MINFACFFFVAAHRGTPAGTKALFKKMMKKLFPILALAALLVSCGGKSAPGADDGKIDITNKFNSTWNIHEELQQNDDGTITFTSVAWGGIAATLSKDGVPADLSAYEAIVFEFAEPTKVETQVIFYDNFIQRGAKGITSLTCYLDGQNVTAVDQVALQTAEPTTLRLKRVYLVPSSGEWVSTTLWDGECVFGNWTGGFVIQPERFVSAKPGDRLEFVYETDPTAPFNYWQIKTVYRDTDNTLEGNASELNEWGCATVGQASTDYRVILTANDVTNLKETGLFTNGYFCVVKQVNLLQRYHDESGFGL